MNVPGESLVKILAKRDHRCPLLKAVLPIFHEETGSGVPWRALRSGASVTNCYSMRFSVSLANLRDGRTSGGPTRHESESQNRNFSKDRVPNI